MMMWGRTSSGRGLSSAASSTPPSAPAAPAIQRKVQEIYQSAPENQCCADCTARLSDSVWASTTVGAFLCIHCAGAHRKLGVQLSRVKSLHLDAWLDEDVPLMKGGNKRVHDVYGKFLDKWIMVDASYALHPKSETSMRERCIRAKYEDMKFTRAPTAAALALAAQRMSTTTEEKGSDSPELPEETPTTSSSSSSSTTVTTTPTQPSTSGSATRPPTTPAPPSSSSSGSQNQQRSPNKDSGNQNATTNRRNVIEISKRFLNYFVVLGRGTLVPNQNLEKTKGPTDIQFLPTVLDCYPDEFDDSPMPSHLAQFAFPDGFALCPSYVPPTFFSFVLTNVNGIKTYACALRFYEELHPLEVVSLLAPYYHHAPRSTHSSSVTTPQRRRGESTPSSDNQNVTTTTNQTAELPKWVQDLSGNMTTSPGPVFCPKCIVVTSHHPYFSAFRQFLQQIYRITLSDAPMPIERYITNFVREIPLPPPGQIQVQLTLPDRNLVLSRPPRNDFPMVDYSFRPLFQALDISNVLQLFTCAVLEFKIVLCSKHIALLTPVAETILALLLPFVWQGAYIPVLPSSLLDVIDAPVPFLVGMHSDCMKQAAAQSTGVVFVDLDHNRVIPAVDEHGKTIPIPKLPEREGAKLRVKLFESANIFDPFAAGLSKIDLAFPNDEHLEPIGSFSSERGHTVPLPKSTSETTINESSSSLYSMGKIMRGARKPSSAQPTTTTPSTSSSSSSASTSSSSSSSSLSPSSMRMNAPPPPSPSRQSFAASFHFPSSSGSSSSSTAPPTSTLVSTLDGLGGLTDSKYNDVENFSTKCVRRAFLRFFVTLLKKYASYLNLATNGRATDALFDHDAFLRETCDASSRPFVAQLVATQMFDRFVEDRVMNGHLPEVLFFDQSINQKLNRSLTLGKKKYDVSFLDDRSDEIRETFIAPPPSNIGLPDDGTVYKYKSFPKLKKSLFGNVRKPRELFTSREQQRNASQVDFHQRIFTMSRCLKGSTASWEATRRLIIHLQTQYRMYSARKKYQTMRRAAIVIQRWGIAHLKGRADRARFLTLRRAAVTIQSLVRMHILRTQYRTKRRAIHTLQFFARMCVEYSRFQRAKRGIRRLQAQWRSSFHKRSYKNLKHQIIRVQSRVRGRQSRARTMRWKEELFEGFRRKIFDLWEQCDVPLLHRSKFWLTFNRPDFFNLGIYLEEERRLQAYFRGTHAHDAYEYSTQTQLVKDQGKKNGLRQATMTALRHMVKPAKPHDDDKKAIHDVAGVRIEEERHQIYDSLKRQTSVSVRTAFYRQFQIPVDSKKKKRRLANLVWTSYGEADISAQIVVTVSCFSDRYHPLPAQIDRHKQIRIREDLAFTVNAALKSIRYASHPESTSLMQPKDRELIELQHQVRMLAAQNHRLMGELMTSQREMSRLQMELQLQQQPQLRKISTTGPTKDAAPLPSV